MKLSTTRLKGIILEELKNTLSEQDSKKSKNKFGQSMPGDPDDLGMYPQSEVPDTRQSMVPDTRQSMVPDTRQSMPGDPDDLGMYPQSKTEPDRLGQSTYSSIDYPQSMPGDPDEFGMYPQSKVGGASGLPRNLVRLRGDMTYGYTLSGDGKSYTAYKLDTGKKLGSFRDAGGLTKVKQAAGRSGAPSGRGQLPVPVDSALAGIQQGRGIRRGEQLQETIERLVRLKIRELI